MEHLDTASVEEFLQPYLPSAQNKLFVTATWAQSLDARIAAAPGERTQLSGLYTKKMTHFLRAHHDGILVGKTTVQADDPSLNCRYTPGCKSPRPIILGSPGARQWKVLKNAELGYPQPWLIVDSSEDGENLGFEVIRVKNTKDWPEVCEVLAARGIKSLMVEGGARVLETCLLSGVVDSTIITIAPVFLGRDGVATSPSRELRPKHFGWWTAPHVPDSVYAASN